VGEDVGADPGDVEEILHLGESSPPVARGDDAGGQARADPGKRLELRRRRPVEVEGRPEAKHRRGTGDHLGGERLQGEPRHQREKQRPGPGEIRIHAASSSRAAGRLLAYH
jgi:hypothetical protein